MLAKITVQLLKEIKPSDKPYDIRDTELKGFLVRVNPSGKLVYMCEYGRAKRIMIGRVDATSLTKAREAARDVIAEATLGGDPKKTRRISKIEENAPTSLLDFIDNHYASWIKSHTISGTDTVTRIKRRFKEDLGNIPLKEIKLANIEAWRTKRLQKVSGKTVNRDIAALRAALNRAVKWGLLESNPMTGLEVLKTEHHPIVRYLKPAEEESLRKTLTLRNEEIKAARCRTNEHRRARNLLLLPDLSNLIYVEYLHPMIILSMNTGIRCGELLRLTWEDINLTEANLIAKSRKSRKHSYKIRHIPLNSEALTVLKNWQKQCTHKTGPVFINEETGKPFTTIQKVWITLRKAIGLKSFRWHDFRHHFASKLVMAGVDLNTVRELLGHSDIKMTLRYAHLAPEHKAKAVEKLVATKQT